MRLFLAVSAALCLCGAGTAANASQTAVDGYQPFEVTRSPVRRGHAITTVELVGAPVSLRAYGREARARRFDAWRDLHEARAMKAVFDGAPQPALVTFEARVPF